MGTGFVVRGPDGLWFAGRDAAAGVDIWASKVGRACTFDNEDAAVATAVALIERNGGEMYWVYEVIRPLRRWKGGCV